MSLDVIYSVRIKITNQGTITEFRLNRSWSYVITSFRVENGW